MQKRQRIKLELTQADKTVEIIGWLLIFAIWGLAFYKFDSLPDIIPTHYNGSGVPDGFGDKWMFLTLSLVATVLFVAMTVLNKFPHIFNYPTYITVENAVKQYTNATRLIRYLKVIIVAVFGLIAYQTIRNINGQTEGLGAWFLPLTMVLIFIPLFYFIIKSFKTK